MKRAVCSILISAALIGAAFCTAEADGSDGTLELLEGGTLVSGFRMSLGFMYGTGSRPDGLGTPVSTERAGIGAVSGNPAGLARLSGDVVLIDLLPPFGASASEFVDFDGIAAEALDDAVEDVAAPGFEPGYPSISADVGQQGGLLSGAVGIRFGGLVVAGAFEEPLYVAMDLVDTGLEAFGQTTKEEDEGFVDVSLRVMADAAANMSFETSRTTLAAATDVTPDLAAGVSVSRYYARARVSGAVRADGIINYGGQEYVFNDPSDPWHNELGLESRGSYEGVAYGFGAGVSWRPLDYLTVDAAWSGTPDLTLTGSLTTVENAMPGAVDGDLDLDQIAASEPTLTERTVTVEDEPVTLLLPSHLGLAATLRAPFVLATLEYRRYSGAFGFDYEEHREGLDVSDGLGLELDFGVLRLGGGVIRGTSRGEAIEGESAGDSVLIPMANLGAGTNIGANLRVDTMLLALPMQVLRVSLSYGF
jgi:hypothetical protein